MICIMISHLKWAVNVTVECEAQELRCSPSGTSFNNSIPSYYDRDINETEFPLDPDNNLIIFSVPTRSLNCSGEVTAVEFYYTESADDVRLGTAYSLFSLLILDQKNLTFEVMNVIDVASIDSCSNQTVTSSSVLFCRGSMQLQESNRFSLPESSFAFGILPLSSTVKLVQNTADSFLEPQVQQFSLPISALGTSAVGKSITVSESNSTMEGFTLLQFVISELSRE